nr:hypothetical protein [Agromyces mariniharenae]
MAEVADAEASRDGREHVPILPDVLDRHERDPIEPVADSASHFERQTRLADPTRSDERDEPRATFIVDPREQGVDLGFAPDDVGRRSRKEVTGRLLRVMGWTRPRSVEALGEEGREVGFDEARELGGIREGLVGGGVVVADPFEQRLQTRLAVDRPLHVDELGHLPGYEAVLVLETRELLAGCDPSVLLPVDADEDVALR